MPASQFGDEAAPAGLAECSVDSWAQLGVSVISPICLSSPLVGPSHHRAVGLGRLHLAWYYTEMPSEGGISLQFFRTNTLCQAFWFLCHLPAAFGKGGLCFSTQALHKPVLGFDLLTEQHLTAQAKFAVPGRASLQAA